MDPAGLFSFSCEATYSNDAVAAAEGTGLPPTAVDMVNKNGEEADKKKVEERGGTASGTKPDHDKKNSDQEDKQNHGRHRVIIKEIEHLPVYMAVLEGDLNVIHNKDPEALSSPITENLETPLHVAIQAGLPVYFIKQLVDKLPEESLLKKDKFCNTVLHNAAIAGNAEAARIMVDKNPELPQTINGKGDTPLHRAAAYGHEEVVFFLLSKTKAPSPFEPKAEARLLNFLITAGFYGYAFDVINDHPKGERFYVPTSESAYGGKKGGKRHTARGKNTAADEEEKDRKRTTAKVQYVEPTPLTTLAQKPEAFERKCQSKCQLGFCQPILHYVFPGNSAHKDTDTPECGDVENPIESSETRESEQSGYRKGTYSQQGKVIQAVDLLKLLIEKVMENHPSDAKGLLAPPLETAARLGNHVFIKEDVFNILFLMDSMKHFAIGLRDRNSNNMLHLAGQMYKPSSKISGAALQMQRELQWFKEVEKIVQPSSKEEKNREGKTPREVFTEEHEDLVKKGEEWMKNAASSCSVVAALVVTVMFAAAITVPGGNNDIGVPNFLDDTKFLFFSVSIILGLFSSSISLLVFLGMLTSRYAEDDFLKKLPRMLIIGLITLLFSLTAMLAAFSVSIHSLLFSRMRWIWIPIYLIASMLAVVFWLMQSRLLYEIFKSTYATTIFREKPAERMISLKMMSKRETND